MELNSRFHNSGSVSGRPAMLLFSHSWNVGTGLPAFTTSTAPRIMEASSGGELGYATNPAWSVIRPILQIFPRHLLAVYKASPFVILFRDSENIPRLDLYFEGFRLMILADVIDQRF